MTNCIHMNVSERGLGKGLDPSDGPIASEGQASIFNFLK